MNENELFKNIIDNIGCPTIKHDHRRATSSEINTIKKINPEILINKNLCLYCNPYNRSLKLKKPIFCPLYKRVIKIEISNEIYELLEKLFDKYFIPTELRIIIYDYYKNQITYVINEIDLEASIHMSNCKLCAEILLNNITLNTCPNHIIVRNYCDIYNFNNSVQRYL